VSDSGNQNTYQGYQDAASALGEYATVQFQIRQALAEVRTGQPAKIVRAPYDASGNPIAPGSASAIGYVDVQPMVNQVDGAGSNPTPHGTVYRLSYHRYQGGYGAFISDPKLGDIGHMVVADRDTSAVRATSAPANPGSGRRHDLADGTFFGQTQAAAPTQWFSWTATGMDMQDMNGNTITSNSSGITINGVLFPKAGISFNIKTHTHNQPNDSANDAEMPTNAPNNGS